MICLPYYINTSLIPDAGKGLFLKEATPAGKIIIAPTAISDTISLQNIMSEVNHAYLNSSVRWFEDQCTVSPDWPDECYLNHAFAATGVWHLGFTFAAQDLPADTEVTVDYRHLLAPGVDIGFPDHVTGQRIVGFSWATSLRISTTQLHSLLHQVEELERYYFLKSA